MSSRDLGALDRRLISLALSIESAWQARLGKRGEQPFVICTYRSSAEQDHLFAQGRTAPGPIVTHAKGGESMHNRVTPKGDPASLAIDYGFTRHGAYVTDGADPVYREMAEIARDIDPRIVWGGDWPEHKRDVDHIQWSLA